jgi:hypothetical protein
MMPMLAIVGWFHPIGYGPVQVLSNSRACLMQHGCVLVMYSGTTTVGNVKREKTDPSSQMI